MSRLEDALSGQLVERLARQHEVHWRLEARSGLSTRQVGGLLATVDADPFEIAVISTGVNDVIAQTDAATWITTLQDLATLLRERFGTRHIIFAPLPPMQLFPALPQPLRWYLGQRAGAFNRSLLGWVQAQADCSVPPIEFDPGPDSIALDGFHPGPATYARWADAVMDIIRA